MPQLPQIGRRGTRIATTTDGVVSVYYHNTPIVVIYPSGRLILDHGGWMTPTTKTHMNQASRQFNLGFRVYQEDFVWYVSVDGHNIEFDHTPLTIRNGASYWGG